VHSSDSRLACELNRPERAATCQPRASIREFHERLRRPGLRIESSHEALKGRNKCQTEWTGVARRDHRCRTWLESHVEPRNVPWNVVNGRTTRSRTARSQSNERPTCEPRNQRRLLRPFRAIGISSIGNPGRRSAATPLRLPRADMSCPFRAKILEAAVCTVAQPFFRLSAPL
jgi:hypothetical protein